MPGHHLELGGARFMAAPLSRFQTGLCEISGYSEGWGLGRHVLGSNYFHYVRDPWGSYAEYSCDIDYIPVTQDWKDGDHPPEDSFLMWGSNPPEDFAHNFEIAK